jgi:hypothetical protein
VSRVVFDYNGTSGSKRADCISTELAKSERKVSRSEYRDWTQGAIGSDEKWVPLRRKTADRFVNLPSEETARL